MEHRRLSKGLRRHIRQEKATIRRKFNNETGGQEKIKELILKHHAPKPLAIAETSETKAKPKKEKSTKPAA